MCYQSTNPCANVSMHPCSCQGVMRASQLCENGDAQFRGGRRPRRSPRRRAVRFRHHGTGGHDLIDTCIDELADSIDDVVSRPCHRLADARGCRPTSPSVGAPRRVAFAPGVRDHDDPVNMTGHDHEGIQRHMGIMIRYAQPFPGRHLQWQVAVRV